MYNILWGMATAVVTPFLPFLLISKKIRTGLTNRFGYIPKDKLARLKQLPEPRLWFHAASVGELSVVAPIVRHLKQRNAALSIVVTTMTTSGLDHVARKIPEVDVAFLAPLDYPAAVRKVVHQIQPALMVVAETELWPNLILTVKSSGSQLALVNGRLSEKNVKPYRLLGNLMRRTLEKFELLTIQSESDAQRFIALGANPQRIKIVSNVKSDQTTAQSAVDFRRLLRLKPDQPVWVAGSTRPGEEAQIIDAFKQVRQAMPEAVLILAPRHLNRLKEIERLLMEKQQAFTYRSRLEEEMIDFPVIVLDTMGELAALYGCAQVALVGGSLAPFGGHNPLEPALQGVPVVVGPHMNHFAKSTEMLLQAKGALQVEDGEQLAQAVIRLLTHPHEAKAMGRRAHGAVASTQGSAMQTAEMLLKLMLIKRWSLEVKSWRQESVKNNNYNRQKETLLDDDWLVR